MRLNYYRFPDESDAKTRAIEGCEVTLKNGVTTYARDEEWYDKHVEEIAEVDFVTSSKVSYVKAMIKQYGGSGWTEHIDRDGGMFETTEIKLTGNNSRFKYNHHL